ncbi:ribokinase [Olsenella profusa]|uniref:Ribokinase n=1 Tax=Olsenella profusa TaxID=138595 RepID=A0ABS2F080_9ACTN|nr:ribokinase [Olsenella profusa]MBM6774389.1 ribokinase [Olsenella profusa]
MPRVIVFGSVNMDLSVEAPRMPAAGETINGSGFITNAGGKGANQAVAAARLGADVRMVAAVGADSFGDELVAGMEASGVDCADVRRLSEVPTGVAVIVRVAGDNRIVLSAGANHALGAEDVISDLRRIGQRGDVFLTQGECDPDATLAALRAAHELGLYTIYNPAPARPVPDDAWSSVDLVCLNETECEIMCGVLPADGETRLSAARRLRGLGVGAVVITLGSEGSFGLACGGDAVSVPAVRTQVVDTTGAGDTFIGALAAGYVRGLSLEEAMRWGAAASAVTVSRLGAQQAIPTAAEVAAVR